ncbi:MAG TPA: acyl-CoA dehydrogenase family protein [Polyangiaceae bacterium]|nr:acyl-CoA dehydrogenase family protein [Polyangiaceae bacterium]
MKSLFFGTIEESRVFPWPEPPRSDEERGSRAQLPREGEADTHLEARARADRLHTLLDAVRRFFELRVDSREIDRQARIPEDVIASLKELGLFGMAIPQAYGGMGLSNTAYARVVQEMTGLDSSVALTLRAHQSIGSRAIVLFGSEEQKARYLPRLARGEDVAAFALTEPGAGSDAAAIQTRAERQEDGSYLLNGTKTWITNGGLADVFTVFARTSRPDSDAKPKITAFIVERGWGVQHGPPQDKLGARGTSTTELVFEDVRVPAANVLDEPGRGFKVAMSVLDSGRLGLASGCLGLAKRLVKMSVERCKERRAFGRPIGEFGLIKDKIATMMAETWALECMTYMTTGMVDAGVEDFSIESAICKVYGSEACWRVVNETMQIAGAVGYMADFPYERLLRDARINLVFEGTNEILRAFIALGGMQGPGQELADLARAMREPIKGFGLLSDFAIRKARGALVRERLTRHHPTLNREAVIFDEYVQALGTGVESVLRRHGVDIAEMQYTQKRTADMAIQLYALVACIARTTLAIERRGEEGARREIDLTSIFASSAERRLARLVAAVGKNDDELRKEVATRAYADGGYPFDVV